MKNLHLLFLIALGFLCTSGYAQAQQLAPTWVDQAAALNKAGNFDAAYAVADSALHQAEKTNNIKDKIRAKRLKGKSLFSLKKQKEAVDLYFDALSLCKSPADDAEIALLYSEIGFAYFSQGHYQEAKSYYQRELPIRRALKGADSVGDQLINLSVMHQDLKEFDSALLVLNQVAIILSRTTNPQLAGYYYLNRGAFLQLTGNKDSAAWYYHRAYDTWKAVGNDHQIFKATFNLGYIAEEQKKYKEALTYYFLSIDAAKKFGSPRELAHVYGTMAENFAAFSDFKNAYDYLYKYAILSDSLAKGDFNNYVVSLDKKFQTEKNREIIREQQLKLNTANLEVQQQRNKALIIIIILVVVVLIAVVLFGYLTFQGRVKKQVEEAKSRFFANVVHEIRTPLSMIQGPIKVLQSKTTDPALTHQLEIAERNTTRLNDLINQMLDISKIDAAKYTLTEGVGNLSGFLAELTSQYQSLATEKNITFSAQTDILPGNLIFDKDALEKILGNLLGNAIKYTPTGGSIGLDVATTTTAGAVNCTFHIWDTGPGISSKDKDAIFDRFYRASQHRDAGTKGIGIGLSLVKDLVNLMNGTISVDGETGKGSVFTVNLALKATEPQQQYDDLSSSGDIVLLVEDDKDILDFNKILLTGKGFNVLTATNGMEASTILKQQLPDIVVTDLMMPGKDGLTLLREIRANQLTSHLPVIILSAKTSAPAKTEGIAEGAQAYLPKPFLPDELIGLVRNQLQIIRKYKTTYQQQASTEGQSLEDRFAGTDPFTQKCFAVIAEHLDDAQFSVEKLAELLHVNRSHFQRKIKTLTGYSPSELIRIIRLEKARELLKKRAGNITEVAYMTGFTAQSYFTKCYSEHFGYPPSQETSTASETKI
jgi:two-component system sensor histidine kinase ChiS